ncbi:MAG: 4-alpha-glucanotransferase [Tardiphaga sp.]|nr:4-alpha-glucanotransferase [Tardiphaga sp.]
MDLYLKAAELGIQTDFVDGQGQQHRTDEAALKIILGALPVRAGRRFVAGPIILSEGQAAPITLNDSVAWPVTWSIMDGDTTIASGKSTNAAIKIGRTLPMGNYRAKFTDAKHLREDAPLIVAPPSAFAGDFDRVWLLAIQLYGLTSERNWGIGDFTDLKAMMRLAASLGAAGVGLNPLHVLFDDRPGDCSPYSPNSRSFLNPLYIDVSELPGVSAPANLAELKSGARVDYRDVAAAKWKALRDAFDAHRANPDPAAAADFEAFRAEQGALLDRFACFEALRHHNVGPWWEWPDIWAHPNDEQCAALRAGPEADAIAFVEYVQWIADRQLRACRDLGDELGLSVGLYLDVAVGVQADGFDAWNEQVAISRHLAVGAPPDFMNLAGQNWGLAGFNAAGLEVQSFAPYRDMLRSAMRYAGAIRLDHVLGLKRLYLVPHGFEAKNGVYVQMPFEALLAVTAQESVANRCVVIGEDLGTVPEGFREQLNGRGVWSYRVMLFERDYHDGRFENVDYYPTDALVTFNTHDLATFAGWSTLHDLKVKRDLGIDPGESDESRHHALAMYRDVLKQNGIDRGDFYGAAQFLARTKSRLLIISLEDLLGIADQPNIPGTVNEHPNWRQRLPVAVDEIASRIDADALRAAMRERGGLPSV